MNAIVYLAIQFYTLLSKLSIRKLYAIGDVISRLIGHAPIHEEMLEKIEQAFPDTEASWRNELIKKYFRCTTSFVAEFLKYTTWPKEEVVERMTYLNLDLLKGLLAERKYVVCYSGHFVNYELFAGLPHWIEGYGVCNFYDDNSRKYPYLDKWLKTIRDRNGAISIPISSPLRPILKLHSAVEAGESDIKGFVIGSLSDIPRRGPHSQKVFVMGQEVPLATGTEKIGRRLGAAFVYAHISCPRRGYYTVTLKELHPDSSGSYMAAYIEALEANIREQPELWLMWSTL